MYSLKYVPDKNKCHLFLTWARKKMLKKGNNKYFSRLIWIVMGGCVRDESYGCVMIVKIELQLI